MVRYMRFLRPIPSQSSLYLALCNLPCRQTSRADRDPTDYTERWVFYDNWTYTASLELLLSSSEVQAADRALLVFYGIDTVANVVSTAHTTSLLVCADTR